MQKVAHNSQILEIIKDWSFKIDPLADLNTTASSGKASLPSLSHNVTRWRQKKNQAAPVPLQDMVLWFLLSVSFLKMVSSFCSWIVENTM